MIDPQTYNVPTNSPVTPADPASPAALQGKIDTLKRLQHAARFQVVITVIVGVGMFAAFTAGTYTAVQNNFSDTAISAALERHVPAVLPQVTRELQHTLTAITPTYRKVIAERYPDARKEIADKVLTRIYAIPDESGKQMLARLQTSFDRVLIRIQPELVAAFPNLTNDQRRDLLAVYFHDAIAERNAALASHINKTVVNELARTHQTLEKFALPIDETLGSDEQLQKQLSKTIMLLVDEAVNDYQESYAVAGADGTDTNDVVSLFNQAFNPTTSTPAATPAGITPGVTAISGTTGVGTTGVANVGTVTAITAGPTTAPTTAPSATIDLGGDK